ncbi:sialidase family protein [Bacillus cereus]|nr:sialidase family protein [Bacillus cereus]
MSLCTPGPNNNPVTGFGIQNEPSIAVNPLSDSRFMSILVAYQDFTDKGKNKINVSWSKDGINFEQIAFLEPPIFTKKLDPPWDSESVNYFEYIGDPSVDSGFRSIESLETNSMSDPGGFFLIAAVAAKNQPNPTDASIIVYPVVTPDVLPNNHIEPVVGEHYAYIVSLGHGKEIWNDKPNLAIDKSGGSPYLGRSYISYSRLFNMNNPLQHSEILIQRSEDYGLTWSEPIRLSEPFNKLSKLKLEPTLIRTGQTLLFENNTISYDTKSDNPPLIKVGDTITIQAYKAFTPNSGFRIFNQTHTFDDKFEVGESFNRHGLSFTINRAYGFNPGDTMTFDITDVSGTILTPYPKNQVGGSSTAVGPEGQVYVGWIESDEISLDSMFQTASFNVRRSDDGGGTFHPVSNVTSLNQVPDPFDTKKKPMLGFNLNLNVLTQANLAVDTSTGDLKGRIYAVWQQAYRHTDFGLLPAVVMLSFSDDKGDTWSSPKIVSPMAKTIYNIFPSITVSRNTGRVAIVFYSNACTSTSASPGVPPTNSSWLDVMAVEWDGDVPNDFSSKTRLLTNQSFDPTSTSPLTKRFSGENWIGDYIGAAMVPQDKLIAVWTDTRAIFENIYSVLEP